jgi:hypothetical protein
MKKAAIPTSVKRLVYATIFIVTNILSISTSAQNVYKCGESYSQFPCAGGDSVKVDDARDLTQKKQSDDATLRDAKQARTLEKERVVQERAATPRAPAVVKALKASPPDTKNGVIHQITPKRLKTKVKKSEVFVAEVPGSEKKPGGKKAQKKKKIPPA